MKTSCFVVALLAFGILNIQAAQTTAASTGASQIAVPKPTAYRVIDAGANHRVWQNETYEKSPDGQMHTNRHAFTELCSGLNYLKAGQWVESKEQIEVLPHGGAAAVQGQHQAYFPGDIYNGFIELVTPDGQHLKSRPLGLSYDDGNNTVFIAVLTNSIGQLVGSNQVIYPDAFTGFTGFKVDLRYTYTKAGFEQDIVLRAQPPTPESLGLNPDTARLQVLTEFFSPPQPAIQARELAAQAGLSLTDQSLGFGAMQMVPGRAFLLGNKAVDSGAQVGKQWLLLDGRQFLVEEVPVDAIADGLATLPLTAMQSGSSKASHTASRHLALPPQRLVKNTAKTMLLAKAGLPAQGFVLDYQTVNTSLTNYTFQGDTTYYISGPFSSFGTNTFEGGTVIKFATNGSIAVTPGPPGTSPGINWKAGAYRPVIFTAKDDNTVGESFGTGNPTGYYGNPMLTLAVFSAQTSLTGLRMSYAKTAMQFGGASANIYDAQFINCQNGLILGGANVFLGNALFANTKTNFIFQGGSTVAAQSVTFSGSLYLATDPYIYNNGSFLALANCILANVNNLTSGALTLSGSYNGFYNTPNFGSTTVPNYIYPFQTVGGGSYYLTNGCNFFNQGTTNIDATLLASLRNKTTYPPLVYSNVTISAVTTFSPQAQRDTDTPDLGYHYDPLDYAFGGVRVYSNLTFTAGTAVGWFELPGSGGPGYGISIYDNVILSFNGTAASPCTLARYGTVQEGGNGLWKDKGWLAAIAAQSLSGGYGMNPINAAQVRPNFTRHAALAGDPNHYREYNALIKVAAQNSEFWNGYVGCYWVYLNFTNCLFDRTGVGVYGGNWAICGMRNCTMHGGYLTLQKFGQTWPVWIEECAFDGTTLSVDYNSGDNTNITYCDFNAFLSNSNRLPMHGTHDVIVTNYNWQSSWLGNYYLPSDSPLINKGSTNANLLGLYHYTTQTSQVKETNSIVDIGYHYVAIDPNSGLPFATYTNGIPDYLLDSDGNGLPDWWELKYFGQTGINAYAYPNGDFLNYMQKYQYGLNPTNLDTDGDGRSDWQEIVDGTDPLNPASYATWAMAAFQPQPTSSQMLPGAQPKVQTGPDLSAGTDAKGNFVYWVVNGVAGVRYAVFGSPTLLGPWNWAGSAQTVDINGNGINYNIIVSGMASYYYKIVIPTISITSPANNVSLNTSRVNVTGSCTESSLKQITVNGVPAFINGSTYEALNVPLVTGANTVTATATDFAGNTATATISITGSATLVDPVQLSATPIGGFAPLPVTLQAAASLPGTIQQVLYDFNGDNLADQTATDLNSITHTYSSAGQYFPVVTVQTTVGRFSSIGGWNAADGGRLKINVQAPPVSQNVIAITDPVDLKCDSAGNLYVLSRSTATITEYNSSSAVVRSLSGIGTAPSGLDVDSAGNVYVAMTGDNQVWKFNPTVGSFNADTGFGNSGKIGVFDGDAGSASGQFKSPFDIAVSPDSQTISVSDSGNNRIQQFSASSGAFISEYGSSGNGVGQFSAPKGVAYDGAGYLYIVDSGNNRVVLALSSSVIGTSGTSGSALGQFQGGINLGVGSRGIYVADTGNNRVQIFDPLATGDGVSPTPFTVRGSISTEMSLNQPNAVAATADFLEEKIYIADTGNNRIILCKVSGDNLNAIQTVWQNMKTHVASGDINGALSYFSIASVDEYRQTFLAVGTPNTISAINQIGTLTPDSIDSGSAEFYFTSTIGGQIITFPVEFENENGVWKIVEF